MADCKTCNDDKCPVKHPENIPKEQLEDMQLIAKQLCEVRYKIIVLSGKGGVGKSTIAVNLASALSKSGSKVGLLDIDIHGPSVPTLLNIRDIELNVEDNQIIPPITETGLKVFSSAFLLKDSSEALIWRGPLKMGAIKQFLRDVHWGCLDYLIVDCPPGTGDEPLSIIQLINHPTGAIIVTTPQVVAMQAVRKSITFCNKLNLEVLGIVENMSYYVNTEKGFKGPLFAGNAGEVLSKVCNIPLLTQIPFDPDVAEQGDRGIVVDTEGDSPVSKAFSILVSKIKERLP